MSTVAVHYDEVLSDVYAWMLGGFESALARNAEFFERLGLEPRLSGVAVDLGAGCGFQSIPLAERGFSVTAIDIDRKLLGMLRDRLESQASTAGHAGGTRETAGSNEAIKVARDDLMNFDAHLDGKAELIVCMTDTLLHLETRDQVRTLFEKAWSHLEPGGKLVLTYRDLTNALEELDRFLPVRSDDETIFTCFLEYEPDTVKVHDLVYRRIDGRWKLGKSFYRKLRVSKRWVDEALTAAGFGTLSSELDKGAVTTIAAR